MAVSKPLIGTLPLPGTPWSSGNASFWIFNDGAGPKSFDALGQSHGTNTAVTRQGQALVFNGSTSVIACVQPVSKILKTTKFSGVVRAKSTAGVQQALISDWNPSTGSGWQFVLQSGGQLSLAFSSAAATNFFGVNSTATFNDGKLRTYGFSYVGNGVYTGIALYVDGVLQAIASISGGTSDPGTLANANLRIGLRGDNAAGLNGSMEFAGLLIGDVLSLSGHQLLAANPWALWPDEPQLVFAPVTTFTGTATTSQAQTAAATGLAGNIGTATSSQAQTAAATGLSGYIGTATASQAQTANATGLAGVIGNATSSQAQSATGAGAETYNGNATSSQAQTAEAVGIAGVIGTATTSQAQTSDAIGVAGIVGTATSSQAQTVNGAGNNGQLSVQFGGHIAQPQYIHVPMFARGTGKATCKSKPHVRVLTRALAIGRSKGTCRPLARQFMAGRAVGASVPVISSMRLQYNETWHAQRARDDQSLLFGF